MLPEPRTGAFIAAGILVGVALLIGAGGWPGTPPSPGPHPDCELIGGGLIAQPAAAWSSLVFLGVGVWIVGDRRFDAGLFAAGFAAVGLGSFLGHAAGTEWSRQLDSLAIKALLLVFVGTAAARFFGWTTARTAWTILVAAAGTVALQLSWEPLAEPLFVLLAVAATLAVLRTVPLVRLAPGLVLLAVGAAVWWLGRDGGPLCDADAILPLHAVWHILAAGGLAAVYRASRST
ncbi:MAG: hypothetical protein HKN74_03575 [Acidimicrobiia bacterium]|nr:hypothetical protein [Acidimicrobiia bacterium]NNF09344.1 hypothetical protein [Acidimicrobiia bacterium]